MTEQINGATEAPAASDTQPPAGNGEAQAADPSGEHQAQPESISLDEAKKLRSEASSLRRRLKDLEDQDKARQDAELSETERMTKRIAELEAAESTARQQLARERTVGIAARLGFADPDDAIAIIARQDPDALEAGDDGTKAAEKALADLAKSKPYLLTVAAKPVGSFDTGTAGGKTASRTFTREQLRDPAYYRANETDILAAMREGRITG